jgi:hypothetical protein
MRAKVQIVPRPEDGSRNAPGEVQASLRRDRYKESLASDLGVAAPVRVRRPQSSIDSGTITLAVIAAIITFLLVVLLMMWRDGNLPRLWPERGFDFAPKGPTTEWMQGGERELVVIKPKAKTTSAPVAKNDDAPIDAKAEWEAASPPPPKPDDTDQAE